MVQDCHVRLNLLVASLAKEKAKHHGAVESLKVVQKVGRRRLAMIGRPFRYITGLVSLAVGPVRRVDQRGLQCIEEALCLRGLDEFAGAQSGQRDVVLCPVFASRCA